MCRDRYVEMGQGNVAASSNLLYAVSTPVCGTKQATFCDNKTARIYLYGSNLSSANASMTRSTYRVTDFEPCLILCLLN